jgi:hypothetical protein
MNAASKKEIRTNWNQKDNRMIILEKKCSGIWVYRKSKCSVIAALAF